MRRLAALLAVTGALAAGCVGGSGHPAAVSPSPATASPTPSVSPSPSPRPRPAEADRPGDAWAITPAHTGPSTAIEGFADRAGVRPGTAVHLYVSTTSRGYVVRAYRMGWYRGMRARLVWTSRHRPGARQTGVHVTRSTNTVSAAWRRSLTVDTTRWLPGDYLLRLDADSGYQSFVPLTVRSRSVAGRIVLVSPVTTWQAYNLWGGADLYAGQDGSYATRSRAVSFDRPYEHAQGAAEFLTRTLPVVALAERLHLPLAYLTDVDLQRGPGVLRGARAVVSMGHDEYYSPRMRAALTAARAAGTNLAFLGANAIFRRIRFGSTALGPNRLEIGYKDPTEDPLYGRDDARVTANWPAAPDPRPESSLIGPMYDCFPGATKYTGVVVSPGSWLFAGTGVRSGARLPGLIGPETDRVRLRYPTPRPIQVLLHSPVDCNGTPSYADTTYYVAGSGAGVFASGTIDWVCAVGGGCSASSRTATVVRRVTANLLRGFAQLRAGRRHPAHDNLAALAIS